MPLERGKSEYIVHSNVSEGDEDQSTEKDDASQKTGSNAQQNQLIADIAAKENEMVIMSRNLMLLVLFLSAIGMGMASYYLSVGTYKDFFVQSFSGDADLIMSTIESRLQNNFKVMGMLSKIMSSSGNKVTVAWPIHTFADFDSLAGDALAVLNAEQILYAPLVRNEDRLGWEQYSSEFRQGGGRDTTSIPEIRPTLQPTVQGSGSPARSLSSTPTMGVTAYPTLPAVNSTLLADTRVQTAENVFSTGSQIPAFIHSQRLNGPLSREESRAMYSPVWQVVPHQNDITLFNYNLLNVHTFDRLVNASIALGTGGFFSELIDSQSIFGSSSVPDDHPRSILVEPIFSEAGNTESTVVGHLVAFIPWSALFEGILAERSTVTIDAVFEQTCGEEFTYSIGLGSAEFKGYTDGHDEVYDEFEQSIKLSALEGNSATSFGVPDECESILRMFPSEGYKQGYFSKTASNLMIATLVVFALVIVLFNVYDGLVRRRQKKVYSVATKSNAIVSSLFPAQIRDKLIADEDESRRRGKRSSDAASFDFGAFGSSSDAATWTNEMQKGTLGMVDENSPPIADLFPSATVAFMDISGFTAWSSQREPSQVFILLETIYRAFDRIAKRRRVFKVETIGDCYVAVCGLPEPNKDHAVVMARFARECLEKMNQLTRKLEISLGPDTAELAIRAGLHSGPVTAGVLRGDRARFQLFGDTVNTAARMESTGTRRKIHISKETAELIIEADHADWVKARQEIVVAKGKGEMQTYWLLPQRVVKSAGAQRDDLASSEEVKEGYGVISAAAKEDQEFAPVSGDGDDDDVDGKIQRLVDYSSEILQQILKRIVAKRGRTFLSPMAEEKLAALEDEIGKTGICLDEVEEIIELPGFDEKAYSDKGVELDAEVVAQLVSFVKMVAMMYRPNPFHNFDHASHVTQSTSKLLSRIVAVKHIDEVEKLHDHTYGITSDPLTQFAVVFASLIHDVDHRGVPNFLLIKEEPALATMYRKQAVAEQNSVDVAWNLLMDPNFTALRHTIYSNEHELRRFRKLVVNCLMATDIFDKELAALRKARWHDAFFGEHKENEKVSTNRKATIVIEHIVQASDVSHTMQHWHVYSKWNERLYAEMFSAYCKGRSSKDPTEGWYEGELWFFDNYVIPLAHKLKDCGVFGVSSDEYLNYALANRAEWEEKGKDIVATIHERYKKTFDLQSSEKGHRLSILGSSEPTPNRHE